MDRYIHAHIAGIDWGTDFSFDSMYVYVWSEPNPQGKLRVWWHKLNLSFPDPQYGTRTHECILY